MSLTTASKSWVPAIPSALSLFRMAMAIVFPMVSSRWRATVIIVAGLSDLGDGCLARRLGVAGPVGGHVDAITDKVFALSILITLTENGIFQPWQLVVLLSRDGLVIALSVFIAAKRRWIAFQQMPARNLGKITTAFMFGLFLVAALSPPHDPLLLIAFTISALCSVAAAVDYFIQFIRAYSRDRRTNV